MILSQSCLTVSSSVEQKRKGLRGSVDIEKIKCVETVQPEPNAPPERKHAFQVDIVLSFFSDREELYRNCQMIIAKLETFK